MSINDLIALLTASLTLMAGAFAIYMLNNVRSTVRHPRRTKSYKAARTCRLIGGLLALEPVLILSAALLLGTQPSEKMPDGTTITYHMPTWLVHNGWKGLVCSWGLALLLVLTAPVIKDVAAGYPERQRRREERKRSRRKSGVRLDQPALDRAFIGS